MSDHLHPLHARNLVGLETCHYCARSGCERCRGTGKQARDPFGPESAVGGADEADVWRARAEKAEAELAVAWADCDGSTCRACAKCVDGAVAVAEAERAGRLRAEARLAEVERQAAAMREALELDIQVERFDCSHYEPPCTCSAIAHRLYERYRNARDAALSSDAGKGWLPPEQVAQVRKAFAALCESLRRYSYGQFECDSKEHEEAERALFLLGGGR